MRRSGTELYGIGVVCAYVGEGEFAGCVGTVGGCSGGFCDFALRVYLDGMVYFARLHNARKYGYASALFCVFGCCDFWLLAIGSQG